MNDRPTTPAPAAPPGLVAWIAANRPLSGVVLLAAGVGVAAVAVVLAARYHTEFLGIEIMTGLLALLLLAAGVWQRFRPEGVGSPVDEARMLVLGLGGLGGLLIAFTGILLSYEWWEFLTKWLRQGEREGVWRVLVALAVLLAGLAVMFISLQAARTEVRQSPGLRRLVYGYNTVLAGVLLFLLLAVANVLAYTKLPSLIDSTESGVYKLSDRSIQILRGLDRPVHIFLLMSAEDRGYDELNTLLSNAQEYAPQLHVETLSPGLNTGRIRELVKEYSQVESAGLLIVYGEGKDKVASFIKADDLMKVDFSPDGQRTVTFEGESRLMTELSYLAENKQKPVVYFTSKNAGEMDFNDSDPNKDTAIGLLQRRLAKRKFDVRPLTFDPADPKVPDDATIVVVPNPTRASIAPVVDALRKYLDTRKGKLVVLTEVPATRGDTWPATGLEPLLAAYNVQVANERVLTMPTLIGNYLLRDPEITLAMVSDAAVQAKNRVAVDFKDMPLQFLNARVIRPAPAGNPTLQTQVLLNTPEGLPVWTEGSLSARPRDLVNLMRTNPQEARQRLSREPLPLAVLVTESAGPPPVPMGGPPPAAKPRLAVFGNASWVGNSRVDEQRSAEPNFDLFASTLDWLRERPTSIGVEPRTFKNYIMDRSVSPMRLLLLPALFALVGIVGLAAGVWVVRRR
jgi:hypothetical protein